MDWSFGGNLFLAIIAAAGIMCLLVWLDEHDRGY